MMQQVPHTWCYEALKNKTKMFAHNIFIWQSSESTIVPLHVTHLIEITSNRSEIDKNYFHLFCKHRSQSK